MTLVADVIECDHKSFYGLILPDARIEELYSDCLWAEGPVWFSEYQALIWSDIPNQRLLSWTKKEGVSVFRAKSNFANGNTRDGQGRLLTCEHGERRITRTENDGSITVIVDSYIGKKLNSPNDLVVKSDGSIWFTDPNYGIMSNYEGYKADMEQAGCYVYRVIPESKEIKIVADDFVKPNGLAFSEDEKTLYIADSARSHDPDGPHHIRAFDVDEDGKLRNSRVFCNVDVGVPDGLRVDIHGNIWTSCENGVVCFDAGGTQLGIIKIPQTVANLTFGGAKRDRLFITATKSLYAVYVASSGIQRP
jgi:gluconolactonase